MTKTELISQVEQYLASKNFNVFQKDTTKPWGAYWYISPESTANFLKTYFPNFQSNGLSISPKILLVEPQKRLSLQLHHRRSEEWHVIQGPVKIIAGEKELILNTNQSVTLKVEENHRLCGLDQAGIVAEIWIHTDPQNPSDELDIIRLEDDFARK